MNFDEKRKIKVKYIVILLSISLGLRLTFFVFFQPWDPEVEKQKVIYLDATGYHNLAVSILEHGEWGNNVPPRIQAIRTPLFPLFAAAIYTAAGKRPWVVLLMQAFLDTGTCLLLFFTFSRFSGPRVGFIVSLLYGLNPFQVKHCCVFAGEILLLFFLLSGFHFFTRALTAEKTERQKTVMVNYALAGLFTGLAALTRPISQFIPVVFAAVLFYTYRHRLKYAVKYVFLFVLVFLTVLTPWMLRNYLAHGRFFLSISGPYNLLMLSTASMEAAEQDKPVTLVQKELLEETGRVIASEGKNPETMHAAEKALYWQKVAVKKIKNNPFPFFKAYVKGVFHIFVSPGTLEFSRMLDLPTIRIDTDKYAGRFDKLKALFAGGNISTLCIALVLLGYLFSVYAGVFFCWFAARRRNDKYNRRVTYLCCLTALYFVVVTGAAGVFAARFKIPMLPFLLPAAALGYDYLYEKVKSPRSVSLS